ncbi:dihydrolipoamide acetyltransferase family protein [Zophobihabitans entericus]|uniref:Dihydrolipoamide acetyltransferase component of pyruvate dehydrogenase complex n=1 Tax=Zophobihabitans entericus TaxID=1635327 RepID=A0A6G9I8N0_9GAMM|nr:dihydrolipoamide acetyltransferase family protein [Zophobihabitans entericus]QIQ20573.1 2-oxo acid dehydrogenase subunit E2 [Zophobihabitans entericus]
MAYEIKMPQLGLTMTEGTVGRWLKREGESVNKGDVLVEIETDKIATEIESEFSGTLLKILQQEGEEVPVQGILCLIGEANENVAGVTETVATSVPEVVQSEPMINTAIKPAVSAPVANSSVNGRVKASPLAKKMAMDKGIDLSVVSGSGPGGRIVKQDILNHKSTSSPIPVGGNESVSKKADFVANTSERREKMKSMRKTVASRMLQSHLEIPGVTQTVKVDVTCLLALRKQLNAERDESQRFSINDFILKATSKALWLHKEMLISIDGDEIIYHDHVNLGMAVSVDSGLIVPVIRQAESLTLESLSVQAKELAKKAREGTLSAQEYQGNTFTISNLGMFGIESFTPIINQPDAAILGVCAVQEELALSQSDELLKKQVMRLSLTFDHRLLDGVVVAKFQKTLTELLENPMNMLL